MRLATRGIEGGSRDVVQGEEARGRLVLGTGLALGSTWYVLGEQLLDRPAILGMFGALWLVLALLQRSHAAQVAGPDRLLLGGASAILVLAALWRDSEILFAVDLVALAGLVVLSVPVGSPVASGGVSEIIGRGVRTGLGAGVGAIGALGALDVQGRAWVPQWTTGLGVVVISPVLLLFAGLLSSADPLMGRLLSSAFDVNLGPVLSRLVPVLLCSWIAAGLLWALTRRVSAPGDEAALAERVRGRLPARMVVSGLTALAALFAFFLVLQGRFLLAGRAFVLGSADLTFAEYARRGFFELVVVCALTLPLLLGAEWVADQSAPRAQRPVRLVLRVLLALLGGLVASAAMRMVLYASEFGLTELRLYTTAFMLWIGFVLAWLAVTIMRDRRSRFVPGTLGAALLVLLALNLLNPAAWIVRVNVARAVAGHSLDAVHVASLGGGAVAPAIASLGKLELPARCALAGALYRQWVEGGASRTAVTVEGFRAGQRAPDMVAAWMACGGDARADRDT